MGRMKILKELAWLQDAHCKDCEQKKHLRFERLHRFCIKQCVIGKRMRKLGDLLDRDIANRRKKRKVECND